MAQWQQLVDTQLGQRLESWAGSASTLMQTLAGIFSVTEAALRVYAALVADRTDASRAIISAFLATIEATVADLQQNNLALCLHVNVNWNPDWEYRTDWLERSQLPWQGGGMGPWLGDIYSSTLDETDPFRPLTDTDTAVHGFIIVHGVTSSDELENLKVVLEAFTQFSDFEEILDTEIFPNIDEAHEPLTRLGSAVTDEFVRAIVTSPAAVREKIREDIGENAVGLIPVRGAYPKWAAFPMARLLPVTGNAFAALQELIDAIKPPLNAGDMLSQLAETLAQRADMLEELANTLDGLIETLLSLATFFESAHVIWIDSETGGMVNFISDATNADDLPDFGDSGIVMGVVGVVTADDPTNHLQAFWEFLGVSVDTLKGSTSQRSENIQAVFED